MKMKNKKMVVIMVLIFVVVLGGATFLYNKLGSKVGKDQLVETEQTPDQQEADEEEKEPLYAPDFIVYDAEDNEVNLSTYFGKPIVLNFWASWCDPCKSEMPDFNEKYLELGDEVHFLMVNMTDGGRETVETASDFVEAQGFEFPVFYDKTSDAAMKYGAFQLPVTFFINSEGIVIAQAQGAIDAETLQQGIDMILEK